MYHKQAQLQKETAACHELAGNLHEELKQTGDELQKKKAERAQAEKEAEQAKAAADKYEKSLNKAKTIAKEEEEAAVKEAIQALRAEREQKK